MLFTFLEFLYGYLANSLGLISDSAHMLFDSTALGIGLYASFMAHLKSNIKFSFGFHRFEILSGYINAIFLLFIAVYVMIESLERLFEPPSIEADKMMVISILGFLVNILGIVFFHEHAHNHGESDDKCFYIQNFSFRKTSYPLFHFPKIASFFLNLSQKFFQASTFPMAFIFSKTHFCFFKNALEPTPNFAFYFFLGLFYGFF